MQAVSCDSLRSIQGVTDYTSHNSCSDRGGTGMVSVGVAKLKASLSAYLARVKAGEVVVVTEHGRPIARLVPAPSLGSDADTHLAQMERSGPR